MREGIVRQVTPIRRGWIFGIAWQPEGIRGDRDVYS
jgi:hypothetical protein